ncbi:MAG TPA: alpha/beta hydrolase-fold protein [Actinomycetota bacterium]|nr:alpha/beta hydrolase-fold protein [Actinomycetota bacterium]
MTTEVRGPQKLAITQLTEADALTDAAIDEFIHQHDFPIIEGPHCTFIYRGKADQVWLRHTGFSLVSSHPFKLFPDSDLWYAVIQLPEGSRLEYKFEIWNGEDCHLIEDPLNPMRAEDPFGANSVCHSAGYQTPDWTLHDPEAPPGEIENHLFQSDALGRDVHVKHYIPAGFDQSMKYPLLIVHDGEDYLRFSNLGTVLDNLIHRAAMSPVVVALIDAENRLDEYAADPRHAEFLSEELVPQLELDYPLIGEPAGRGLMGGSFGAVASLSAAYKYPKFYGRLILQSGSFAFSGSGIKRPPVFDPIVKFVNEFRDNPIEVAEKWFISCGVFESLIYENRALVSFLRTKGVNVTFVEARDGHNWENWRDRLLDAFSWLFPPGMSNAV